jgi:hypothetical protein
MAQNRRNSGLPKPVQAAAALCIAAILCDYADSRAQSVSSNRSPAQPRPAAAEAELLRLRADFITKTRESRADAEKLLALHEQEQNKLKQEYDHRRTLYQQGLISRAELDDAERALTATSARVDGDKRWITESDIAMTEASFGDEILRLPRLASGGYSENGNIVRYNGIALWSLTDAGKIENFFTRTFGQRLPISAFGQTPTHDRLRFDHRNAIDVALHPDSSEGKSLQSFLREAGIPFIAFRNAAPGAATGAHIHIGQPSPRK